MDLQERLRDRWQRIRSEFGSSASSINSLNTLYRAELHDVHGAELQAAALADEIWVAIRNEPLAQRVSDYAGEMRSRITRLEHVLSQFNATSRERPDEVMHALVHKASELAEQCSDEVRDTALVAALQRIIHVLSADYDTLAMHAAALGRQGEATQFLEDAERNKAVGDVLTELAGTALNLQPSTARPS